jgi:protein-S-isoprenylcysteine O-methyltransferase Ste14
VLRRRHLSGLCPLHAPNPPPDLQRFLLAVLGTAIINGLLRSLLGFALIALTWHDKALSEERLMQHAFSPAYDKYRSRTGSMVPRLR